MTAKIAVVRVAQSSQPGEDALVGGEVSVIDTFYRKRVSFVKNALRRQARKTSRRASPNFRGLLDRTPLYL
jgi:hypothetical protein